MKQTLNTVVGDSFILNNEFTEALNERVRNYLTSELKTTRGGIFFGNKTFEIPDATEKEVRQAIKAVTGSEIAELNGSFFLTPSGFSEKDTKKHIKNLKIVKNNNQELAYWNNRKIYPADILKQGNLKMIDDNQYLVYMKGNNKNSDFLRVDGGGYFMMGF